MKNILSAEISNFGVLIQWLPYQMSYLGCLKMQIDVKTFKTCPKVTLQKHVQSLLALRSVPMPHYLESDRLDALFSVFPSIQCNGNLLEIFKGFFVRLEFNLRWIYIVVLLYL